MYWYLGRKSKGRKKASHHAILKPNLTQILLLIDLRKYGHPETINNGNLDHRRTAHFAD